VDVVLDLWQVVESDTSSTSHISLVDVLRRLSMCDVADAVKQELDVCVPHRRRHSSLNTGTLS